MGSCDFTRVFGANIQTNRACGFRGITCYGNARMFSVLEEVDTAGYDPVTGYPNPYPHRLVHSFDNGQTWAIYDTYRSQWNIWFWRQISPQTDRILVGNEGPDQGWAVYYFTGTEWVLVPSSAFSNDMALACSDDGGVSWVAAVPDDFFDRSEGSSDYWDSMGFVIGDAGVVFAYGSWAAQGAEYTLLRSTDNGRHFAALPADKMYIATPGGSAYLASGCYCGDGIVLFGEALTPTGGAPRIWRSTDNGQSFSAITMPSNQHAPIASFNNQVFSLAFLGNHTALAMGIWSWGTGATGQRNRAWRSTDDGATWTEITDALPAYFSGRWAGHPIVSWGDGLHAIMPGPSVTDGLPAAYFTENAGDSWQECLFGGGPRTNINGVIDFGIADDGSVCATANTNTASPYDYEIWRAVPSWTVPGPCYAPPPPQPPPLPGPGGATPTGPCPQADLIYERRGI